MNKTDWLCMKIEELEDDIACMERDEELGEDVADKIDTAACRLADLRDELKELK